VKEQTTPKKRGRPKLVIDEKLVADLARIQCTQAEIAAICGCSVGTINERYSELIKSESDKGKSSLRRWQWKAAEKGNVTMMIWLGKNMLGQSDRNDIAPTERVQVNIEWPD